MKPTNTIPRSAEVRKTLMFVSTGPRSRYFQSEEQSRSANDQFNNNLPWKAIREDTHNTSSALYIWRSQENE
jgi:hypothetical protein